MTDGEMSARSANLRIRRDDGGATAILARLIAKGSGKPIDVYATEKLFSPLGIDEFEWVRGGDGEPSASRVRKLP